ncbi:MAG: glycosyltransferase family 2 protein [Gemmatimonadaceae bacterium]
MLLANDQSALAIPEQPLLSVVIPAYNAGEYLGAALDSVLNQSLSNLEVIVVDDGSTDATAAVAYEYAALDPRVRVHRREKSSGKPAVARNEGIRLARGSMIALLDADDIATPTRFEDEVNAMAATGAGVAFADFHKFRNAPPDAAKATGFLELAQFVPRAALHLQQTDVRNVFLCREGFVEYMLADAIAVNVQTVMFRRDLLAPDREWFDTSYMGGEDLDLFYRLARRTSFVYVNAIHAFVRVHSSSLTVRHAERCLIDAAEVRRINFMRLQDRLNDQQVARAEKTLAQIYFDIGYMQWVSGMRTSARRAFTISWQFSRSFRAVLSYAKSFVPRINHV